jgi:predicted membrane protein
MYICAPTLIYLVFAITQIFLDTFQGLLNSALIKSIVTVLFALMLNLLCKSGMGIISWIIVLIPFLFMSVIVTILLVSFGLDPSTGEIKNDSNNKGGNLIFSSSTSIDNNNNNSNGNLDPVPNYSTDPQYESFMNFK